MTDTRTYQLGKNAKLYYGIAGAESVSGLTEIPHVKDVTVNHDEEEYENTGRDNNGWNSTVTVGSNLSIDFQFRYIPGDTIYKALKAAQIAKTPLSFAALSGDRSLDDAAEGPLGDFVITKCSRSEPLKEGISVDVTIKLNSFTQWIGI